MRAAGPLGLQILRVLNQRISIPEQTGVIRSSGLGTVMTECRFRVGQLVRLQHAQIGAPNLYEVVRILPVAANGDLQYRLRGIHEPHERLVEGHQISSATTLATVRRGDVRETNP